MLKKKSQTHGVWGPFSPAGSQYIQDVSEIGIHILDTRSVDQKKEEMSYKHVSHVALFPRYDHFQYQGMRTAASCSTVQGRHFEHLL